MTIRRWITRLSLVVLVALVVPLALPQALLPAAIAAPQLPDFGRGIDGYAVLNLQTTCDPTEKPGAISFRTLLLQHYPSTGDSGITRACGIGGTSEHKEGRAWDWQVSAATQSATANDLLNWLLATDRYGNANALIRRFGIMYMIWNNREWDAFNPSRGWYPYQWRDANNVLHTCPDGDDTICHRNHVHFSFSWDGAHERTSWWTGQQQIAATTWAGGIYHTIRATGAWTGFGNVEGPAGEIGSPAFVGAADVRGELHVLAVSNGRLYHAIRRTTGSCQYWGDVMYVTGEIGTVIDVAGAEVNNELHVLASTSSGGLFHTIRRANGAWTGWSNVEAATGDVGTTLELSAAGFGPELHVLAVASGGTLRHAIRRADGTWTGFGNVEDPAG